MAVTGQSITGVVLYQDLQQCSLEIGPGSCQQGVTSECNWLSANLWDPLHLATPSLLPMLAGSCW